jgi:hypothetical protein
VQKKIKKQTVIYKTRLGDDPRDIIERLELTVADGWVAHYDALRGWQIAAVDGRGTIYIDCDQQSGRIHIWR